MTGISKIKRILILGGNRFLGPRIAALLLSKGHEVATFNRSGNCNPQITSFRGNRNSQSDLERALSWHPHGIVDTSLYFSQQAFDLAQAVADREIRYVTVSTASVYSNITDPPWSENAPVEPHPGWGRYALDKLQAEKALQESVGPNVALVILRPVYFLGPGNLIERCTYFFSRIARSDQILVPGNGEAQVQFVDVDHLTTLIFDLLQSDCIGTFNVASTEPVTITSFILKCAEKVGIQCKLVNCSIDEHVYDENLWPFPNLPLWVSVDKLRSVIGYSARSVDEIVKREFDWWVELPKERQKSVQTERELELISECTLKGE